MNFGTPYSPYGGFGNRGYGPMAQPYQPPSFSPYANILPDMGAMTPFAAMGLQWLGNSYGGGGVQLGIGQHTNAYERIQQQQQMQQAQAALAGSAAQDATRIGSMISNISAALTGTRPRQDQVSGLAGLAAGAMPFLAQMPGGIQLMDNLGIGGNTIMSAYAWQAGQYMRNPITGRAGLTGDEASFMGREIFNNLYDKNTGQGLGMNGVRALGAGQMLDEFTRRGWMGSISGIDRTRESVSYLQSTNSTAYANAAKAAGIDPSKSVAQMTSSEIERMRTASPEIDKLVTSGDMSVDAKKISGKLKEYSGAISAITEIMGPNTPMSELMNKLDQITNGSMQQLSPDKVTKMVRQFGAMAKATGLEIEGMGYVMSQAAMAGSRAGLNSSFATQTAINSGAFRQTLVTRGAPVAWGSSAIDTLMLTDVNLRTQANDSQAANWGAGMLRMAEAYGLEGDPMIKALKEGNMGYLQKNFNFKSSSEAAAYMQRISGGKISGTTAEAMFRDSNTNQQYIFNNNLGNTVRGLQGMQTFAPAVERIAGIALRSQMGLDKEGAQAGAEALTKMQMNMSASQREMYFNDAKYRQAMMAETMSNDPRVIAALKRAGVNTSDPKAVNQYLMSNAEGIHSAIGASVQSQFGMTLSDSLTMFNNGNHGAVNTVMNEINADVAIASEMAGVGKGTPIQQILSAMESEGAKLKPGDELDDKAMRNIIAKALGIEDPSKVSAAMVEAARSTGKAFNDLITSDDYKKEQADIAAADAEYEAASKIEDPKARAAAMEAAKEKKNKILNNEHSATSKVGQLASTMQKFGEQADQLAANARGANVKLEFPQELTIVGKFKFDGDTGEFRANPTPAPGAGTPTPATGG